jgi:predicted ATPase
LHDTELGELRSRALNAERSLAALDGMRGELERERTRNREVVGAAKWRVLQRETVERVFEAAQARLHAKAVGSYERLLTMIANDVLPSKIRIRLELGTNRRNGKPSLDIVAQREGGDVDVSRATGGSLMNVLATGLRVSALIKSGARQFAAFDESECWISPDNVPAYGNVLVRLSSDLGFQCLLISHHNPRMFHGAFVVRLDGSPETGLVALPEGPIPERRDGQRHDLFTSIRLMNFQSHTDTTVPLCPGMTCLVGDNDIGKSAVIRALSAIMEGDFKDTDIRHGQREASVELTLADGRVATVRRAMRKKLRWELAHPSAERLESEGSDVPDFIASALGMRSVRDLNLHVSRQTRPNFLLEDEAGMDTRRAEVLSIGREAVHLDRLMEAWKKRIREDSATIRRGEGEDARYESRLRNLADVPRLLEATGKVRAGVDSLGASLAEMADLIRDAAVLEAAITTRAELEAMAGALAPLAEPPALLDTAAVIAAAEELEGLRRDIEAASGHLRALATLAAPPEILPDDGLAEAADRLNAAMECSVALAEQSRVLADIPPPPELAPTAGMMETAQALADVSRTLAALRATVAALEDVPTPPDLVDDEGLGELSERLDEAVLRSAALGGASAVLASLAPPPDLFQTERLRETYLALEQVASNVLQLTDVSRAVADLPTPPQLEETADLVAAAERLEGAARATAGLVSVSSSLETLAPLPDTEETTGIEEAAKALDLAARDVSGLACRLAALGELADPPALLATEGYEEAAEEIESARAATGKLRHDAQGIEAQLAEIRKGLARWRDENEGVCPTCGRGGFDPLAPGGLHADH